MYASAVSLTFSLELKALNIDSIFTTSLTPIKRPSRDRDTNTSDSCSQHFAENLDAAEKREHPFHTV